MSQSTPTPDTTARTETAETVTVPTAAQIATKVANLRHAYAQLKAGTVARQPEFADGLIAPAIRLFESLLVARQTAIVSDEMVDAALTEWFGADNYRAGVIVGVGGISAQQLQLEMRNAISAALAFGPALASPQHPVGVREAVWAAIKTYMKTSHEDGGSHGVALEEAVKSAEAEFATLSRPPAQDAPGAVKVKALEWNDDEHSVYSWPLGIGGLYYGFDRVDSNTWVGSDTCPIRGPFSSSEAAKAAAQADYDRRISAARDPSPPLPEADGEVVAWMRLNRAEDAPAGTTDSETYADLWRRSGHPVVPLVRQSALVSALRERDEALEAHKAALDLAMKRDGQLVTAIAAREKAEQVAAEVYETIEMTLRKAGWWLSKNRPQCFCKLEAALRVTRAALRASTEEGKTATPSVTEEEAGRG